MDKEKVSLETLHRIVPLYDDIKEVYEECTDKPCKSCDFRKLGANCQAMCVAVKLQDKLHNSSTTTLRNFVKYLLDIFYQDNAAVFVYSEIVRMINKGVDNYIKEQL